MSGRIVDSMNDDVMDLTMGELRFVVRQLRDAIVALRTPATPDRARAAASAELGRIAKEAEREAFDSDNSHVVRSLHARYAASLRAVAAGIESATAGDGWTEVTADDVSLPPDTDERVLLLKSWFMGDKASDEGVTLKSAHEAREHAIGCRETYARGTGHMWCIVRWMRLPPWPSAIRAAATAGQGG